MQEVADPALSLDRARETWQKHGRSDKWIQQRMTGQETRNKLTDYWAGHDIQKDEEFAILTNLIHELMNGTRSCFLYASGEAIRSALALRCAP
jgi:hypothetical protein